MISLCDDVIIKVGREVGVVVIVARCCSGSSCRIENNDLNKKENDHSIHIGGELIESNGSDDGDYDIDNSNDKE